MTGAKSYEESTKDSLEAWGSRRFGCSTGYDDSSGEFVDNSRTGKPRCLRDHGYRRAGLLGLSQRDHQQETATQRSISPRRPNGSETRNIFFHSISSALRDRFRFASVWHFSFDRLHPPDSALSFRFFARHLLVAYRDYR